MRCHIQIKQKLIKGLCTEVWVGYREINKAWYRNPGPARIGSCSYPRSARTRGPGGCSCREKAAWQELWLQRVLTNPQPHGREGAEGKVGVGMETVTPSSSLLTN